MNNPVFPYTVRLEAEGVYACEGCGAWASEPGEREAHNRACPLAFPAWAEAAAKAGLEALPEGKQVLCATLRDGVMVVVATGDAAESLWREWMLPRAVDTYVAEVRAAAGWEAESDA